MKIAVIGAGTWGTALAVNLSRNHHEITLWTRSVSEAESLRSLRRHRNLPGVILPEEIRPGTDLREAVTENELLLLAVPSIAVRPLSKAMAPFVRRGQLIVVASKGIEEGTLLTMTEVVESEIPAADAAVLSGPSHAEEVSRFLPTTIVVGAHSEESAKRIQDVFMNESFRVYLNSDMLGIEIGAALKNVIALAAGIADGLGYGDNTKAALITRGIAEIARLGVRMGCKLETFAGLSGIGDLIVTCASMHSRNRRAGILIGKGASAEEAMREVGQVVEGVYAARAGEELGKKYEVRLPIVGEVNAVLFQGKAPKLAVRELMLRDRRAESHGVSYSIRLEDSI